MLSYFLVEVLTIFFFSFYHNAVPCVGIYRTFQYLIVGHADRIRKHEHMIFDRWAEYEFAVVCNGFDLGRTWNCTHSNAEILLNKVNVNKKFEYFTHFFKIIPRNCFNLIVCFFFSVYCHKNVSKTLLTFRISVLLRLSVSWTVSILPALNVSDLKLYMVAIDEQTMCDSIWTYFDSP